MTLFPWKGGFTPREENFGGEPSTSNLEGGQVFSMGRGRSFGGEGGIKGDSSIKKASRGYTVKSYYSWIENAVSTCSENWKFFLENFSSMQKS